ncbi:MAG: ABC transporter ATP-binding protein [Proteobacteria bacterium]|nr:ABC transporter ATP-binding protein [Pseudomonadota bacterium]
MQKKYSSNRPIVFGFYFTFIIYFVIAQDKNGRVRYIIVIDYIMFYNCKMLQVRNLSVFQSEKGEIRREIVRSVNIKVGKGEIVAIVGESGSGKSLTAYSVINLLPSENLKVKGEVIFNDENILSFSEDKLRNLRGKEIFLIPQDPLTALNPVITIEEQLSEIFYYHSKLSKKEVKERVISLLNLVEIDYPERRLKSYPHQLSGGQRQRVLIAMAMALNPKLIIADEPTTALDVSIQKGILDTFISLRDRYNVSFIIITHDFGLVRYISDYIYVMYGGKVVEEGKKELLLNRPLNPYTVGLINSVPSIKIEPKSKLKSIGGFASISDFACPFYERCKDKEEVCKSFVEYVEVEKDHKVLCMKYQK